MCMLWTKQLSIGNTIVDSEHKHLISLTNYVERSMKTAMETRDGTPLQQAFEQLEDELRHHFHNEEKIAQAVNFPFDQLRQAQQHMLGDLHFLKAELMAKDCIWTDAALKHFSEFLDDLILEHITRMNMPMKPALESHGYDFWPDFDSSAANDATSPRHNPVTPPPLFMHATT